MDDQEKKDETEQDRQLSDALGKLSEPRQQKVISSAQNQHKSGHPEQVNMVCQLLRSDDDLDVPIGGDENCDTHLHRFVRMGSEFGCMALLTHGWWHDMPNIDGDTPLSLCYAGAIQNRGLLRIAFHLLACGADDNKLNKAQRSPAYLRCMSYRVINFLKRSAHDRQTLLTKKEVTNEEPTCTTYRLRFFDPDATMDEVTVLVGDDWAESIVHQIEARMGWPWYQIGLIPEGVEESVFLPRGAAGSGRVPGSNATITIVRDGERTHEAGGVHRVNEVLEICLHSILTKICDKLKGLWDIDLSKLKDGARFVFRDARRRKAGESFLTCDYAKKLVFGTGLRNIPKANLQEAFGSSDVEGEQLVKHLCKQWVDCCNNDEFFTKHSFEFSIECGTGLQASRQRIPRDLSVHRLPREGGGAPTKSKTTLFRKLFLAKGISSLAPEVGGDDTMLLEDGSKTGDLFSELVYRCYTSATFYNRFWAGNEPFADGLHVCSGAREGVFVLAYLASLIVERKLPGRVEFEAVLDYIDNSLPGQVELDEFVEKAGLGAEDSSDALQKCVPDAFLQPMQEERKACSKQAVQMLQDRVSVYLSLFLRKHLPLAYPEGIESLDEASRSLRRQWGSTLPPSSTDVAEYADYAMSKVFMNRLVDRPDLQHCCSIFGGLESSEKLLLKHSLSVLFRTREYREHVDPCLSPRSVMRYLATVQQLMELLIRIDAEFEAGDLFEAEMRPGLVWFGEVESLAMSVFRGKEQISEHIQKLQAEVQAKHDCLPASQLPVRTSSGHALSR
jgi:hypothetical protein